MSETTQTNPKPEDLVAEPDSKESETPETPPEDESTIGTGTSMALGCIAGTVVLIGFGLLFLFLSTLI